ncbi:MAG TPA: hypothetical protein VHI93_08935 [Candidatus Thermoplasmatota archaeon]|nr:hypothetical protein [Candidatus Thermoplasmatota archaeon]
MHMGTVVHLLERLLGRHGHTCSLDTDLEGRSGTIYTVPLLAEREHATLATVHLDPAPLTAARVASFAQTVADTGAAVGLLVHLGPLEAGAAAAGEGRVALWGRDQFVRLLGETDLCEALGLELPGLPLDPAPAARGPVLAESALDLLPPAFSLPGPHLDLAGLDLGAVAEAANARPALPSPAAPPVASIPSLSPQSAPPAPAAPRPVASRPLLPVRVTEQDARRKVKDKLFGIGRVELLLQPVHLFDYECDQLREGSLAYDTLDGRIQVNASDKGVLDVDPDVANPDAPTLLAAGHGLPVTERVVRIPEERALELARQHVVRKHVRSVEVRVPDHHNSLLYTERRKVEPTPDQVRLRPLGIHFRPVWRMMGRNGQIDLDALDGRELFSEVRGGRTDAMVVD